jgi:uncharacterized surface protein with fasciclin (FAS1) repeats
MWSVTGDKNMTMKTLIACLAVAVATPAVAQSSSPMGTFGLDKSVSVGGETAPKSGNNIVQVAQSAGQFNSLLKLATIAELAGALTGPGPFTVFAPTDMAFAKIPANVQELLASPRGREQLRAILGIHVVPGKKLRAADFLGKVTAVPTLFGRNLIVDGRNGGVDVLRVRVQTADIEASNGIIHIIGTVLTTGTDSPTAGRNARPPREPRQPR